MVGIDECLHAPGEHLVRIALVGDVEHQFVGRGVEHIVQGYCSLHHAQIGAHMAAYGRQFVNQRRAHFRGKNIQPGRCHPADISRRMDACKVLELHILYLFFLS